MNFFNITRETKLRIYIELLVNSGPIDFIADYEPRSPPLFRRQRHGLYPAILCVSREIHREASPVLYSSNCFRFPEVFPTLSEPTRAHISPCPSTLLALDLVGQCKLLQKGADPKAPM